MTTLRGQQVLVTGAGGFLGGALTARLLAEGVRVRGLVRSEASGAEIAARGAELCVGDLTDPETLRRAVAGCTVVFHVGAALRGPAAVQYRVNVTAVGRLVEAAHAAGVRRIAHVSTVAVYGYDRPGIMHEDLPLRPGLEHYAQSKALGEEVLFRRARELGIEATAIRPGMIYGPGSRFWTGKVAALMQRRPAPLPGDGAAYCPVVYVGDVVDLLLVVAEHPAAAGCVFNAVSDEPVTWRAFLGAYAAMAGHRWLVPLPVPLLLAGATLVEPLLRLGGEPQPLRQMVAGLVARRRGYSMNRAADLLGWRPRVRLVEGMAQAESWLRETGQLG